MPVFPLDPDNLEELMDIFWKEENSNSMPEKSKSKRNESDFQLI